MRFSRAVSIFVSHCIISISTPLRICCVCCVASTLFGWPHAADAPCPCRRSRFQPVRSSVTVYCTDIEHKPSYGRRCNAR
jgi:hypothetical protein